MYLIKLIVESIEVGTIIREIDFKLGLNLILDAGVNQTSGNDIGKTTFLRAIDFCLGAQLDELYIDRDEDTTNEEVKKFLINNEISFSLSLGKTFGTVDHVLKRYFTGEREKNGNPIILQTIDGEPYKITKYRERLNIILFSNPEKPSIRDLMPKFIREDRHSVDSMLRYLGDFKSDNEYNSLHLILFGYRGSISLEQKNNLYYEQKSIENKHRVYTTDYGSINKIEAELNVKQLRQRALLKEIEVIQEKISQRGNIRDFLLHMNELAQKINTINSQIIDVEIGIENIQSSIDNMSDAKFDSDISAIKALFDEAKIFNVDLHEKFDATVQFHNSMLQNKIRFANKSLKRFSLRLAKLLDEKEQLLKEANIDGTDNSEFFKSLGEKNHTLIEITGDIKERENVLEKIKQLEKRLLEIETLLTTIVTGIQEAEATIKNNINIFNEYFSDYSYRLYGEEQFLSLGQDISEPFVINNKANSGSGKKKAYITAFDLAYTEFIAKANLPYPRFVGEDLVELIDEPQLKVLFEVSNSIQGQLIIPVLHSKVSTLQDIVHESTILTLSDSDRFFRF